MIRIIDNFLDETLLENVFSFISLNCNRNVWRTSLSWNQDIVLDSNIVQLLPLTENSIQKCIPLGRRLSLNFPFWYN